MTNKQSNVLSMTGKYISFEVSVYDLVKLTCIQYFEYQMKIIATRITKMMQ